MIVVGWCVSRKRVPLVVSDTIRWMEMPHKKGIGPKDNESSRTIEKLLNVVYGNGRELAGIISRRPRLKNIDGQAHAGGRYVSPVPSQRFRKRDVRFERRQTLKGPCL